MNCILSIVQAHGQDVSESSKYVCARRALVIRMLIAGKASCCAHRYMARSVSFQCIILTR